MNKLEAIRSAHSETFRALGDLLRARKDNRIVIMPGNHDADFFWPGVRSNFAATLGRSAPPEGLSFHLEPAYLPEAVPGLWIEHGHQHDPCNRFFVGPEPRWSRARPPILIDQQGCPRLLECVGTRFMNRFMNSLDVHYRFVDNVKPMSRVFRLIASSAVVPGFGLSRLGVAMAAMMRYLRSLQPDHTDDLLSVQEDTPSAIEGAVRSALAGLPPVIAEQVADQLELAGLSMPVPLALALNNSERAERIIEILAEHPECLVPLQTTTSATLGLNEDADDGETLALGGSLLSDETVLLKRAASRLLSDRRATSVVMGHTHEQVRPEETDGKYANPGCWTRCYRADKEEYRSDLVLLLTRAFERFPYELNYIEACAGEPLRMVRFASP